MDAPPVQYVTTSDGYSIAYTVSGRGRVLIFFPPGFESVQTLWKHFPAWMQGLAARFRLISFDARGEGLSTRGLSDDLTLADFGRDVEAIAERFPGERFVLYALGTRGHHAVRFAIRNSERVDALIWNTASIVNSAWPLSLFDTVAQENWWLFLDTIAGHFGNAEERRRRVEEHARCVNLEDLRAFTRLNASSSVENDLPRLPCPLLVLHPRDFPALPAEESMKVAARATNARYVPIDGSYLYGDAQQGLAAIDNFIAEILHASHGPGTDDRETSPALSVRELQVLRLLAAGKSNQQIADQLVISLFTVNRHVSNIYAKTGAANRAEAASFANRHGLA